MNRYLCVYIYIFINIFIYSYHTYVFVYQYIYTYLIYKYINNNIFLMGRKMGNGSWYPFSIFKTKENEERGEANSETEQMHWRPHEFFGSEASRLTGGWHLAAT